MRGIVCALLTLLYAFVSCKSVPLKSGIRDAENILKIMEDIKKCYKAAKLLQGDPRDGQKSSDFLDACGTFLKELNVTEIQKAALKQIGFKVEELIGDKGFALESDDDEKDADSTENTETPEKEVLEDSKEANEKLDGNEGNATGSLSEDQEEKSGKNEAAVPKHPKSVLIDTKEEVETATPSAPEQQQTQQAQQEQAQQAQAQAQQTQAQVQQAQAQAQVQQAQAQQTQAQVQQAQAQAQVQQAQAQAQQAQLQTLQQMQQAQLQMQQVQQQMQQTQQQSIESPYGTHQQQNIPIQNAPLEHFPNVQPVAFENSFNPPHIMEHQQVYQQPQQFQPAWQQVDPAANFPPNFHNMEPQGVVQAQVQVSPELLWNQPAALPQQQMLPNAEYFNQPAAEALFNDIVQRVMPELGLPQQANIPINNFQENAFVAGQLLQAGFNPQAAEFGGQGQANFYPQGNVPPESQAWGAGAAYGQVDQQNVHQNIYPTNEAQNPNEVPQDYYYTNDYFRRIEL